MCWRLTRLYWKSRASLHKYLYILKTAGCFEVVLCLNLLIEQEVNVVVFSPESKGTFLFSVYYQWSTLWSYSFSTNQYRQGEQHGTWKRTQSEQQLKEPAGVTLVPAGGTWIWSLMYSSEVEVHSWPSTPELMSHILAFICSVQAHLVAFISGWSLVVRFRRPWNVAKSVGVNLVRRRWIKIVLSKFH